jgi:quinol monooxygenase YgiN
MKKDSILVIATVVPKPGSEQQVQDAFSALVAQARAEDGCLSYDLFRSAEAPASFVSIESWSGPPAISAHMRQPHVQSAIAGLADLVAAPPTIVTYQMVTDPAT